MTTAMSLACPASPRVLSKKKFSRQPCFRSWKQKKYIYTYIYIYSCFMVSKLGVQKFTLHHFWIMGQSILLAWDWRKLPANPMLHGQWQPMPRLEHCCPWSWSHAVRLSLCHIFGALRFLITLSYVKRLDMHLKHRNDDCWSWQRSTVWHWAQTICLWLSVPPQAFWVAPHDS